MLLFTREIRRIGVAEGTYVSETHTSAWSPALQLDTETYYRE
jgi:hypothetical protein